jgi:translation elongation factor EF-Tu-like GTPase
MSRESFIKRDERHGNPSYRRSRKQEKQLAIRVGGRTTAASGSKAEKGDVRKKRVLRLEAKTTKNKSFSVTLEMIHKIEEAAMLSDELPVLLIEFNNGAGKKIKEVVVCPSYVLDEIAQREIL